LNRTITSIIQREYKEFSLYQVSKLPSIRDGLKPVTRRILQIAKKNKSKDFLKVVELAGLVAPLHAHGSASISGAIVTLGQDFVGYNNYSFIHPKGNYGTRLNGGTAAADRYIWAKLSKNAEKILMVDEDIVSYIPTYDESRKEVEYFLPLIPTVILNPSEAIAVGFACKIIPYNPKDIIKNQIHHLKKDGLEKILPYYKGFKGRTFIELDEENNECLSCEGVYEIISKKKLRVTEVPIKYTHEKYINLLNKLVDKNLIRSFKDNSKETFNIEIELPLMTKKYTKEKLLNLLGLVKRLNPNFTFMDFDGLSVKKYSGANEIISSFTDWRLKFFEKRYVHNLKICKEKLFYNMVLYKIITSDFPQKVQSMSREKMKTFISNFTKDSDIINKICDLPIYRFSKDERLKLEKLLKELKKDGAYYNSMISSPTKRKNQYIKELEELLKYLGEKHD